MPTFEQHFREFVPHTISEEAVNECVRGWREYFTDFDIPDDRQNEEFDGFISARIWAGQISLAPPATHEITGL